MKYLRKLGENFRGESQRKKRFNVKVFPSGSFPLRSDDDYQVCAATATSTNHSVLGYVGKRSVQYRINRSCIHRNLKFYLTRYMPIDRIEALFTSAICSIRFSSHTLPRRLQEALPPVVFKCKRSSPSEMVSILKNRRHR